MEEGRSILSGGVPRFQDCAFPACARGAGKYIPRLDVLQAADAIRLPPTQRNGNASPSVALSLIQKLPDPDDPGYAEELLCARDTAAISFTGEGCGHSCVPVLCVQRSYPSRRGHGKHENTNSEFSTADMYCDE